MSIQPTLDFVDDPIEQLAVSVKSVIDGGLELASTEFTKIVYADDTGPFDEFVELHDSDGVLLLICEGNFQQSGSQDVTYSFQPPVDSTTSAQNVRELSGQADKRGAPYYAFFDGTNFQLFSRHQRGTPVQRRIHTFTVESTAESSRELLEEIARSEDGERIQAPDPETFTQQLGSHHERLATGFEESLGEKLTADGRFKNQFTRWLESQGLSDDYDSSDRKKRDIRREFASQAAYLFVDQLMFYKLLCDSEIYELDEADLESLDASDLTTGEERSERFGELTSRVDFEPVFTHHGVHTQLDYPSDKTADIDDLLSWLDNFDLTKFSVLTFGRIYEDLIPRSTKKNLATYFTPKPVTKLITRLVLNSTEDTLFDPACGSGGFLHSGYDRLGKLSREEDDGSEMPHQDRVSQLHGNDISQFGTHLSTINIALQNLAESTESVAIDRNDFFDLPTDDEESPFDSSYDAVVCNPPYIKGSDISDRDHYSSHLDDGAYSFRKSTDAYVYFLTHVLDFATTSPDTAPTQIGFITHKSWLWTGYGEEFKQFLLDNGALTAIIELNEQVFDEPLVGSSILIFDAYPTSEPPEDTQVDLMRLHGSMDNSKIEEALSGTLDNSIRDLEGDIRHVSRLQSDLSRSGRWDRWLRAPPAYIEFMNGSSINITEIAEISSGTRTGANEFFLFEGESKWKAKGLPAEYIVPYLKDIPDDFEPNKLTAESANYYLLDLRELTEEILDSTTESFDSIDERSEYVLEEIKERGESDQDYQKLAEYIEDAKGDTAPNNPYGRVWFEISGVTVPDYLIQKVTWTLHKALENRDGVVIDQQLQAFDLTEDIDPVVMDALLNSAIVSISREVEGHEESGDGGNRCEITVSEVKKMRIPDPREFSEETIEEIQELMDEIGDRHWMQDDTVRSDLWPEIEAAILRETALDGKAEVVLRTAEEQIRLRKNHVTDRPDVLKLEGSRSVPSVESE